MRGPHLLRVTTVHLAQRLMAFKDVLNYVVLTGLAVVLILYLDTLWLKYRFRKRKKRLKSLRYSRKQQE